MGLNFTCTLHLIPTILLYDMWNLASLLKYRTPTQQGTLWDVKRNTVRRTQFSWKPGALHNRVIYTGKVCIIFLHTRKFPVLMMLNTLQCTHTIHCQLPLIPLHTGNQMTKIWSALGQPIFIHFHMWLPWHAKQRTDTIFWIFLYIQILTNKPM
jgi:hypothetical protein